LVRIVATLKGNHNAQPFIASIGLFALSFGGIAVSLVILFYTGWSY
jgi:hypothetical protein